MLSKLPYEIVSKIYSYLTINEVTSVDIAYREAEYNPFSSGYGYNDSDSEAEEETQNNFFRNLYEDRISMNLYLGEHFSNSQGLLKCMLMNDILLSGSRALDYFVPGSTDKDSDWDFYADGEVNNTYRFMEFMKTIGVTWLTAIEWFNEKLENDEHQSGITIKQIRMLWKMANMTDCSKIISESIAKLYTTVREDTTMSINEDTITVVNSKGKDKVFVLRHDIYASFKIIYGKFNNHGKIQRIQLMVGTSGLKTIMDFYTSALQCLITGFCAAHMYATDAYNRQSRLWLPEGDMPEKNRKMIDSRKKYEKRGFKFYTFASTTSKFPYQRNTIIKRHLKDPKSHVIDYALDKVYPSGIRLEDLDDFLTFVSDKRRKFYEFSWIENGRNLSVSTYHQQEIIGAERKAVLSFVDQVVDGIIEQPARDALNEVLRTGLGSTIGSSYNNSVIFRQDEMPNGYLDQFVTLRT
jgi:hypothetical protein